MGIDKCSKCKNNCCGKNFIGLKNAFKNKDGKLFNQILLDENERKKIINAGYEKFIEKIGDNYFIALNKDRSCKAFSHGKCSIYNVRPDVCKLYPFYFDPFGGVFVDKNCPCYQDTDLKSANVYSLIENRLKLFSNIDGKKNKTHDKLKFKNDYKFYLTKNIELEEKNGELYYQNISLMSLVSAYGPSLSIAFLPIIRNNVEKLKSIFDSNIKANNYDGKHFYAYATKANYYAEVIFSLLKHIKFFETSSETDIAIFLRLAKHKVIDNTYTIICNGFKNENYFTSIKKLVDMGINVIPILDSYPEYQLLKKIVSKKINVGIRYNCEFESRINKNNFYNYDVCENRFGLPYNEFIKLCKIIVGDDLFNLKVFHFHLGGTIQNLEYYKEALSQILTKFVKVKKLFTTIDTIDIGGGLPGNENFNSDFNLNLFAEYVVKTIKNICNKNKIHEPNIIGEYGRYTTAQHGFYLMKVSAVKKMRKKTWYVLNSSFMKILPDNWATQDNFAILPINLLNNKFKLVSLAGNTCDENDRYVIDNKNIEFYMPEIKEGQELYIAVFNIGAYQEMLAGKNGITHCLIPENAEIIIDIKNEKYDIKQITKEGSLKREINMLGYNNINYFKKYIQ